MVKIKIKIPIALCKLLGHQWSNERGSKVYICKRCGKLAYDLEDLNA